MAEPVEITDGEINDHYDRLKADAGSGGYHLNPDTDFVRDLIRGLLANENRYGYWACPCRLASGEIREDTDIICPCDYRDPDLTEYGTCYCSLYVSAEIASGKKQAEPVPERRPAAEERKQAHNSTGAQAVGDLPYPVWRCRVCGYLCAREEPPETCPICKAGKERFERFM